MSAHVCPECQLLHDALTEPGESEAVTLARIAAEQAVQVARIQAGADRAASAAAVEVAHEEGRAEVQAAEAEAELLGDAIEASAGDDDAPAPVEVIAPPVEDERPEDAPPEADDAHEPHEPRKPRGLGLW
jgi:hypothetical protein